MSRESPRVCAGDTVAMVGMVVMVSPETEEMGPYGVNVTETITMMSTIATFSRKWRPNLG